jgi:hypothetical protein
MCFSATGSFAVAGALGAIGVVSLAQDKEASHGMLAAVPMLFAGQQVAEGVVWLTIGDPARRPLHLLAVAAFLTFALVVWPMWVPLSLRLGEESPGRKKLLGVLAGVGCGVAIYAGVILARGRPTAYVSGHSIAYSYRETGPARVLALYLPMYVVPSVLPFFVSSLRRAKLMGTALALSLVATFVVRRWALTSVWCFFAAVVSGVIVLGIGEHHRALQGSVEPAAVQ